MLLLRHPWWPNNNVDDSFDWEAVRDVIMGGVVTAGIFNTGGKEVLP